GMSPPAGQTVPTRSGAAAKSSQVPRSGGPLSLDPLASPSGSPPQSPERMAAAPASTALVPAQPASTPSTAGSGAYVVQLSSQRSEAEAQASFRSLQAKFPDQLGGRGPIIRRADLGDKGIYYRAMVGPFASSEEAGRFCGSYKSAGGQCIIQRN